MAGHKIMDVEENIRNYPNLVIDTEPISTFLLSPVGSAKYWTSLRKCSRS